MSNPTRKQHVFLIPGFLGLENLGEVVYFAHVREALTTQLAALGVSAVHVLTNDDPVQRDQLRAEGWTADGPDRWRFHST